MKFTTVQKTSSAIDNPTVDTNISSLLTKALKGGILAGQTATKNKSTNKNDQMDIAYGASAQEIMAHGSFLPIQERAAVGNVLGRSTVGVLPSGDKFDTRSIRKSNFHASNNNLVGTSEPTFSSGMKGYVEIDYTNITPEYTEAFESSRKRDPGISTSTSRSTKRILFSPDISSGTRAHPLEISSPGSSSKKKNKLSSPDTTAYQRMMYHNGRELRQNKVSKKVAQKTTRSMLRQMHDGTYHQICTLLPSTKMGYSDETAINISEENVSYSQDMLHIYRDLILKD